MWGVWRCRIKTYFMIYDTTTTTTVLSDFLQRSQPRIRCFLSGFVGPQCSVVTKYNNVASLHIMILSIVHTYPPITVSLADSRSSGGERELTMLSLSPSPASLQGTQNRFYHWKISDYMRSNLDHSLIWPLCDIWQPVTVDNIWCFPLISQAISANVVVKW